MNQRDQDGLSVYTNSIPPFSAGEEVQDAIGVVTLVTNAIHNEANLADGMKLALHHIRRYAACELAEIWLIAKHHRVLVRQAVSYDANNRAITTFVSDQSVATFSYDVQDESVCQVSASPIVHADIKSDPKTFRGSAAVSSGLIFNLVYPVIYRELLIGVVILHHHRKPVILQELLRVLGPLTQQIAAAISFNRLHERLDTMPHVKGEAICILDTNGRFRMVNQAFADLLEHAPEYFPGRQVFDFLHPEHQVPARESFAAGQLHPTNASGKEYLFITKTGKLKWLSCACTSVGTDALILTTANEVTHTKETAPGAAIKTGEFNNLVSSLDDVVFEYNSEGNFCNKWYRNSRIADWMPAEYMNKSMQEAYQSLPAFTGPFIEDFEKALADNEIAYRDFEIQKNNETRWFNSKITPLYHPSGESKGFSQRITEITEKKKVDLAINGKNEELKSAHRELREIFENSSEIIIKLDTNDRIIFVSPEFERSFGFTSQEKLGEPIYELLREESREQFKAELRNARLSGKGTGHTIFRAVTKRGFDLWFNATTKFLRNPAGEPEIGIVFAQDVTELKQTMDSLIVSRERYRSVVNALDEGIIMHDHTGNIIACNEAAEKIFGLEGDEALGDTMHNPDVSVVHEDGSPFQTNEYPAMITLNTGKAVKNVVLGVHTRRAGLVWVSINTEPVYYSASASKPDAVVASIFDLTDKKRYEEHLNTNRHQLQEYSDRISGILDSITDGFIAVDKSLSITLWNKVIERTSGITSESAIGKTLRTLQSAIISPKIIKVYEEAIRQHTTVNLEYYSQDLKLWFETSAYPYRGGLFIYFRDISLRKRQESLLSLEKRVLEYNASPVATLKTTVDYFLLGLEEILPGMRMSVITLDEKSKRMRHLSAPSLPAKYTSMIDGLPIGPNAGSCGTAMFTKSRVIVSDIQTDSLWAGCRDVAEAYKLRACWSFPIKNVQNEVLATIGVYYEYPASPTMLQLEIFERVQNLLKVIIENKVADSKVRLINERYLLATKATNDGIWDWDFNGDVLYRSDGYHNLFGYRAGHITNPLPEWAECIHPADRERVVSGIQKFISDAENSNWEDEYRFRRLDGRYVIVNDRGFLIYDQEGRVCRMVGSMQDVTEKRNLEKEILKKEVEKQKLIAQAVVDAQEKERAEIGKELHDNVNQILSTAKLYMELARSDENDRLHLIKRSAENITHAINEIRTISRSLVPPSISDLGIIASVRDLLDDVRATCKLEASFYFTADVEQLINEKQQLMLFRIIQEQVTNVLRHAEASCIMIELMVEGNLVDLVIVDDGKGFDSDNIKMNRGVGLKNISSRTQLFNGEVNLTTAPGEGCKLHIQIPITNQ